MTMKKFKELLIEGAYNTSLEFPSTTLTLQEHTLMLRFDSKDIVIRAAYAGPSNPWLSSMCFLIEGKSLSELELFTLKNWQSAFRDDQGFWEFFQDEEEKFYHPCLELLKASIEIFRGRDYLYSETSPLVCRCFGVREADILEHHQSTEQPSMESLGKVSKAGKGCRSCLPQLKRWMLLNEPRMQRHFKNKPIAEWLLEIDYMLSCFPKASDWKMQIEKFKGNQVLISFDKEVIQSEEEATGKELQDFLGASLDADLAFFLRRARHFSNARG